MDTSSGILQFFIHLRQALILKLQVACACIRVTYNGWLEAKNNEVGQPGLFCQHNRLMILRAQVALYPDEIDVLLRLRHGWLRTEGGALNSDGGRLAGALFL